MDNATLLHYLKKLRTIILTRPSRRPEWFEPLNGLCCNFVDLLENEEIAVESVELLCLPAIKTALALWPHYISSSMYCIPDPSYTGPDLFKAAHDIYHTIGNMYDRRKAYCRLRHDLLNHFIASLEAA